MRQGRVAPGSAEIFAGPAFLAGLEGTVFLRLDLACQSLPRWVAPEAADEAADAPEALAA